MLLHVAQDAGDFAEQQHAAVARRLKFLYLLPQAPELILLLAKQDQGAVACDGGRRKSEPPGSEQGPMSLPAHPREFRIRD